VTIRAIYADVMRLQPFSRVPVTSGMSTSGVINVVGNPSQPVAAAIQPGTTGVQLIAQQPSGTSAILSQSAVVSQLAQPSASAVTASPAGYYIVHLQIDITYSVAS